MVWWNKYIAIDTIFIYLTPLFMLIRRLICAHSGINIIEPAWLLAVYYQQVVTNMAWRQRHQPDHAVMIKSVPYY